MFIATCDRRMSAWRFLRYWLYISHRWLGIVACLLFVCWFASGLVMSYVGYPELDERKRVAALEPIDWDRSKVEPSRVLAALPLSAYPRAFWLEMLLGEPVYRIVDWDGSRRMVSAAEISNVGPITPDQAATIAKQYARSPLLAQTILQWDQWTVPQRYAPFRPLHKISVDDARRTDIYVASTTGEVVLSTAQVQRFWNWLGAVPHWLYFTALRANPPLWRQVNLWISGPAILIAVSGVWIGLLRLRTHGRYPHGTMSPYHGWKLWHHWAGIIGGVFLLAWILSGWLSVNPNQWLSGASPAQDSLLAYAGQSVPRFDGGLPTADVTRRADTRQVHFILFEGKPLLLLVDGRSDRSVLDGMTGETVSIADERIFAAAQHLMPTHSISERKRLTSADNYWYSHHERRPLPVLRISFDDSEHSSFYLDPVTGAVLDFVDDGARRYRWWFNALHRLDFAWLLQYRTLWHLTIWILCVAGLVTSLSAVAIGWRRLRK